MNLQTAPRCDFPPLKNFDCLKGDVEYGKLCLEFLKENSDYQRFFQKLSKDPFAIYPHVLDIEGRKNKDLAIQLYFLKQTDSSYGSVDWYYFQIGRFVRSLLKDFQLSEILKLLNPDVEIENLHPLLVDKIPLLFQKPGISERVWVGTNLLRYGLGRKDHEGNVVDSGLNLPPILVQTCH